MSLEINYNMISVSCDFKGHSLKEKQFRSLEDLRPGADYGFPHWVNYAHF